MNQIKKLKIFVSCILFACSWVWLCQACKAESFKARVVHVIDGDSIIVKSGERKIHIRLWGIDSPEKGQPFSTEAREYTSRLLLSRSVNVKPVEHDDYGRLVAEVFLLNKNSSEEIVRQGYAWVHIFYCRTLKCQFWRILESEARNTGKGLWAGAEPEAPWVWKRRKKHYRREKNN